MSDTAAAQQIQQQKVAEFLKLLPLTVEIAGLPRCEASKVFTEGQLEARVTSLRAAYKAARQLISEIAR